MAGRSLASRPPRPVDFIRYTLASRLVDSRSVDLNRRSGIDRWPVDPQPVDSWPVDHQPVDS